MVKSIIEANKQLNEISNFYKNYLQQTIDTNGNIDICRLIGVSDKLIFKTIEKGSVMARHRMVKKINEKLSVY